MEAEAGPIPQPGLIRHELPCGYSLHVMFTGSELLAQVYDEDEDQQVQVIKVPGWCAFRAVLKQGYFLSGTGAHISGVEIQLFHTSMQSFLYQVLKYNFPGEHNVHTHCSKYHSCARPDEVCAADTFKKYNSRAAEKKWKLPAQEASMESSSTLVDVKQRLSSDCVVDSYAGFYQKWAQVEPLLGLLDEEGFTVGGMAQLLQQWQKAGYTLDDLEELANRLPKQQLQQMLDKRRAGNLHGICLFLQWGRTQLTPSRHLQNGRPRATAGRRQLQRRRASTQVGVACSVAIASAMSPACTR